MAFYVRRSLARKQFGGWNFGVSIDCGRIFMHFYAFTLGKDHLYGFELAV